MKGSFNPQRGHEPQVENHPCGCFSDLCACLHHPICHCGHRSLAFTGDLSVNLCHEIDEMETDPLGQEWKSFDLKCLFQSLHFSWTVQELGSHCRAEERVCVTLFPVIFILHIFLFTLSVPTLRGQANILSSVFPRQVNCSVTSICLWGHSVEGAV